MARTESRSTDIDHLPIAAVLSVEATKPRRKPKSKLPLPDNGATYVWEQARPDDIPLLAKSDYTPPRREPEPSSPASHMRHPTPWSRIWRIFLAGAIMGIATVKAGELLLHRDR